MTVALVLYESRCFSLVHQKYQNYKYHLLEGKQCRRDSTQTARSFETHRLHIVQFNCLKAFLDVFGSFSLPEV